MFSANEVITDCNVCSDSDFAKGIGESPPMIDEIANRKLLRRSVAAILAHMSFEGKLCGWKLWLIYPEICCWTDES